MTTSNNNWLPDGKTAAWYVHEFKVLGDFYRQLGKEPEQTVRSALEVLAKRFNLR